MQPIATDTILQRRYRLIKLIGEGGFGRTYLATDQSRFNERCAIKELSLASPSPTHLHKAQEFFKQEAALLYQLQHLQIPRFWATFEECSRLFLVQDFIPGQTYESLLHDRLAQKQTFTEAEVWRFLLQVLPVLGYLHGQGIIHQDISPDNIILRETDQLPVLIDFGVVKQFASRLQHDDGVVTMVGKAGYAPIEQSSSGQAFPSSDLYALAVTALVLLTGRPAEELLPDGRVNWSWRNWVNISDGLADVLGKMLSYQPVDRYQSSVDVFQALQSLSIPVDRVVQSSPTSISNLQGVVMPNGLGGSQNRVQTVAKKVYSVLSEFDVKSVWEEPRVYIPLFLVMAFVSFSAGLLGMNFLQGRNKAPTVSPTSATPNSEAMVGASSPTSSKSPNAIALTAGQTTIQTDQIAANQEISYEFDGAEGQDVTVAVDNKNLLLTVLSPIGSAVDSQSIRVPRWQGKLTTTGKYTVKVKPLPGAEPGPFEYRLSVSLALPPAASPSVVAPVITPVAPMTTESPLPLPTTEFSPVMPSGDILPPTEKPIENQPFTPEPINPKASPIITPTTGSSEGDSINTTPVFTPSPISTPTSFPADDGLSGFPSSTPSPSSP
jgi:serine/threonine protein kinase